MSTWQLFSDADSNFRWEISNQQLHVKPQDREPGCAPLSPLNSISPLPSMSDLLLKGCSKLLENPEENLQTPPMFRSGLGKSVKLKQSSIAKALSILGDGDDAFSDTGQLCNGNGDACTFSGSMFQTGSGKKVNISTAGLVRAKALLGLETNHDHNNSSGPENIMNQSIPDELLRLTNSSFLQTTSLTTPPYTNTNSLRCAKRREVASEPIKSTALGSPIKFHTAGGRSLSVSSDALKRAKSLLGDLEVDSLFNEGEIVNPAFSSVQQDKLYENRFNKENNVISTFSHQDLENSKLASKSFVSPMRSDYNRIQSSVGSGNNLLKKFDAEDNVTTCKMSKNSIHPQNLIRPSAHVSADNSLVKGVSATTSIRASSLSKPLEDISNQIVSANAHSKLAGEKRRIGRSSVPAFKRPRNSKFVTPLNKVLSVPSGPATSASEEPRHRRQVSTRYPFQIQRKYMKEYFGGPPLHPRKIQLKQLPEHIRGMNPEMAENYMLHDGSGVQCIGKESFIHMLSQSGASVQYATKEWVTNHYKWIVWKLACYERFYPAKYCGKLLTVSNVFEELKYRYEREVNHGHRSAIKRVLEGDQPPSSMMILCISSLSTSRDTVDETQPVGTNGTENGTGTRVQLTDGWYSINAVLDTLLVQKITIGKLFVGQKLKIWGAGLYGWAGPVSPLEASSTVGFLLHINGTYRAGWSDRLGICKGGMAPLAFRCIKAMGGPVPSTLVGIMRVYPVLYKERLSTGGFVVRSERMEAKMIHSLEQRRSDVAEGIMSEFQKGTNKFQSDDDNDSEEGAKILKILESAAEPDLLMAEMTPEQLTSFSIYQAKQAANRQADVHKSIEKALEDAGLSSRDVTPFMRVRVVGLSSRNHPTTCSPGNGLVTIWNPTEKQKLELVEGKACAVSGLVPSNYESDIIYLQARGSSTKWLPLSHAASEHFESFFSPRKATLLGDFSEVSLSSEFDVAALVVYVGKVHIDAGQKKQWVFVTDGSLSGSHSEERLNSVLAISFCLPYTEHDSFAPINHNLVGSTVCFCNLMKRSKDQSNGLWVAEATENSTYFLSYDSVYCSHLKEAAICVERWGKISSLKIEMLRQKVLLVLGKEDGS